MRLKRLINYITIVLLVLIPLAARAGDDAEEIISKIQKKYESLKDLSVDFTENVQFAVTKSEENFTGKLLMKKGNRYRIDMEQQTIVTDGNSVWSYNKLNNQLFIDKYKDDPRSFTPDRILANISGNYTATLLGREKLGGRDLTVLKLMPRESRSNIKWMKVWVDLEEVLMRKIMLLDITENLITYSVEGIKINGGIPDSEFSYEAPEGADVIDLR